MSDPGDDRDGGTDGVADTDPTEDDDMTRTDHEPTDGTDDGTTTDTRDADASSADESAEGGGPTVFGNDLSTTLQGGALVVAVLFALVAAVSFYSSAQRVIDVWVAGPYRPVFTMGFNLVVLLAMIGVVVALVRRLTA